MSNWPQWVFLALIFLGSGYSAAKYGQQKNDKYDIADVLIGPAISVFILWWGGFFKPIGW